MTSIVDLEVQALEKRRGGGGGGHCHKTMSFKVSGLEPLGHRAKILVKLYTAFSIITIGVRMSYFSMYIYSIVYNRV